jgi:hypothetical protein
MWILKGALLGLWVFGFGTMAWLYFAIYRHVHANTAVDVRIITHFTTQSPLWWTALLVSLVLGCAIARSWSWPLIVWIGLLVTGLVPAGLLAMFITLFVKLKQMQGHP